MLLRKADAQTGYFKASLKADPDLFEQIAAFNGHLTAHQVRDTLQKGERVYTAFSYFIRQD